MFVADPSQTVGSIPSLGPVATLRLGYATNKSCVDSVNVAQAHTQTAGDTGRRVGGFLVAHTII